MQLKKALSKHFRFQLKKHIYPMYDFMKIIERDTYEQILGRAEVLESDTYGDKELRINKLSHFYFLLIV